MLNIASRYAFKWHFLYGVSKSMILVFGDSHQSHSLNRKTRIWFLNGAHLNEGDLFKHLGILISVTGSTLQHTCRCISQARSSFFSLYGAGARWGGLHPCTSLKLFRSWPLSLLQFGLDVLYPSNSEILMIERAQLSMLRMILGLPVRAIHYLLGTLPAHLLIYFKHLIFLYNLLALPDESTI